MQLRERVAERRRVGTRRQGERQGRDRCSGAWRRHGGPEGRCRSLGKHGLVGGHRLLDAEPVLVGRVGGTRCNSTIERRIHLCVRDRRLACGWGQRPLYGMEYELVDRARIAEADLGLGGVHIHVHPARVEFEEEGVGGLPVAMQHVRIGFAHRVRQQPVAYVAAVDKEVLLVGAAARGLRRAGEPAQGQRSGLGLDGQARGGKLLAEDRRDAIAHRLDLVMRAHPAVVLQQEGHVGTRQRDALEHALAMPELGGLGAQELAPRGGVEVQVGHRHRGAGLPRSGLHRACDRTFGVQHVRMRGGAGP